MGKAQSKRSVDITTDVKKDDVLEEGTGKMGKIEDVDQLKPQINGDTHHNENEGNEKEKLGDGEATENEKDLSTEKEQQSKTQQATDSGAGGDDANNATAEAGIAVENGNDDTLSESKTTPTAAAAAAESSTTTGTNETTNGDSNKKTKKEKLKKKWSFRSISFGKKDKQKPSKKDEETVNGECEKVPEENTEEAAKSAEQITNNTTDNAEAAVPAVESANAEEKTPEPTPTVNGTESESDNKSPTTDKSSEIVPPATETKDEQPPQQQQQQSTAKTPEPASTEASVILNGADKISPSPAKIEEQSIPPTTTSSVAEAEVVSMEQTSTDVPTTVASTESSESMELKPKQETEASQQEISATTAIPQNLPEEKPTEQAASKEEEQKQQIEGTDVENKSDVKESIEIVPPVSAEVQKVEDKTQIEEQKPEPVKQVDVEVMPVIEKTEEIIEVAKPSENTEPTSVETSPIASQEVPAKEEKPVEMPVNDNLKTETAEVDPKSEGDINPEQIAQTIALIDEITQEALASSQQQNSSEQNTQEVNVEQKEIPPNDATDDSTPPCNASPLEGNSSVPKDPETTSSATIDSQIPLATPSPVVELGSEQNIIDNENKTEQKAVAAVESPETVVATDATVAAAAPAATIQSDEKSVVNDTQEVVTKIPESNAEQAQPEQQQTEETISNTNVVDPAANTTEHVPTEEEKLVPNDAEPITQNNDENALKEAAATADTLKTTDTSKENGIGEDHEVTETSATESLNGQVEQKTAEEIKSEQKSSDIKVEVAPEVAPVAAE